MNETINGEKYRKIADNTNKKIFVLSNGWVFYGESVEESDLFVRAENCKCIRRWGTETGLGELINGPKTETVLDEGGTQVFRQNNILYTIEDVKGEW